MGQIVFTFDEEGNTNMKVENVNGASCKNITKPFEKNLGVITSSTNTVDFYKNEETNVIKKLI